MFAPRSNRKPDTAATIPRSVGAADQKTRRIACRLLRSRRTKISHDADRKGTLQRPCWIGMRRVLVVLPPLCVPRNKDGA